jgi:hypothetical protein
LLNPLTLILKGSVVLQIIGCDLFFVVENLT